MTAYLDLLPAEIILKVLHYLPLPDLATKLMDVGNKRIKRLCQDPKLWKQQIFLNKEWDAYTARKIILKSGPMLKELTLSTRESNEESCSLVILALESSPGLESLKCNYSAFSGAVMVAIGESGKALRKVTLSTFDASSSGDLLYRRVVSSAALFVNAASLRNLTFLHIPYAKLDDEGNVDWVKAIADSCKHLVHVHLPLLLSLNDEIFNYLLSKVHKTLKSLRVIGSRHNENMLSDVSYANLKHCQFEELHLIGNLLGRDGLNAITDRACRLRELLIYGGCLTSQEFAEAFTNKTLGNLKNLSLIGWFLDDVGLDAIATSCPSLERLYLHYCLQVGDSGVSSVLRRCKSLTWLSLTRCLGVTKDAFVQSDNRLTYLAIEHALLAEVRGIMPQSCMVTSEWSYCSSVQSLQLMRQGF